MPKELQELLAKEFCLAWSRGSGTVSHSLHVIPKVGMRKPSVKLNALVSLFAAGNVCVERACMQPYGEEIVYINTEECPSPKISLERISEYV